MDVAVLIVDIDENRIPAQPWMHCRDILREHGIRICPFFEQDVEAAFERRFDAMMLHIWQDWMNRERFDPFRIMPLLERVSAYRARHPETVQIALNHSDNADQNYALLYWRPGDPVLYRTPPYDRSTLSPVPEPDIWPYENVWGRPAFRSDKAPRFSAGFIGTPTGPSGYRSRVAKETAKVGIGICRDGSFLPWKRPVPHKLHDALMGQCRIVVCPRGWGQQSMRHWDAWFSGKPVLTDRECASFEMIPGVRLEEGVHYLVYDDPEEIPDLVSDWTRPSRLADLHQLAQRGRKAALSYDPCSELLTFFRRISGTGGPGPDGPELQRSGPP